MTPEIRIRRLNKHDLRQDGDFVLYWMIANRRAHWNFSLQRAAELANKLNKPLVVLEALRTNYRWASDRLHRFILQGMAANRKAFADQDCTYYAYVEPEPNHASGMLEFLAGRACAVITDDFPCFFIPTMLNVVSQKLDVALEAVDSNGLFPMRATDRIFTTAHSFRAFLQKKLTPHLDEFPLHHPVSWKPLPKLGSLPDEFLERWPEASDKLLEATPEALSSLPIDHQVGPAIFDGGADEADKVTKRFVERRLKRYADHRNDPDDEAASGLSPYLHFGHISAHDVFSRVAELEGWSTDDLGDDTRGSRNGWWGMSDNAESFLDELITWREIGYNMCSHCSSYGKYESLPEWARATLEEHVSDSREYVYSLEEFELADTHDEIWNAAQTELVRDGRMHNYLRMLWGKKILEWTEHPRDALRIMIHLNNKYAVDGRNPNSYSGIFWTLGRYDRAWGPERPIFGKIRFMSSDSTRRKLSLKRYLREYAPERQGSLFD